jgi:hypothetical protein
MVDPVENLEVENLDQAEALFMAARQAFENGQYGRSRDHLLAAQQLIEPNSRLGGDIQLWLVTAYQAGGQTPEAIALGEQLANHPDYSTRKQAKRLVYILKAPALKRPKEWITEIPDLTGLDEGVGDRGSGTRYVSAGSGSRLAEPKPTEPIDPSQVDTAENGFAWIALVAIALIIGILWLS